MKKFEGMLFCTDLDGTLFCDDKTVSKENLEAIEYFKSEGGFFTFITGRLPLTASGLCEIVKPNAPYGCINGGGIYDPKKEKFLWNVFLPDEAVELVRVVDKYLPDVGIQYNTERCIYSNKDNEALVNFRAVTGLPNVYVPYENVQEPVFKILFAHEDAARIEDIKELLSAHPDAEKFDFIQSERTLYEMLPKGISKGNLLCKMAEILGVDRRRTVAVGDYYNDVSMVASAGIGFAVENAVDELKAVADFVTVSNNSHAIAAIVDGLDKGKYTLNVK